MRTSGPASRSGLFPPTRRGSGRLWRTTTFRLTTLLGAVFAGAILLLLGLVYLQTAGYLTQRVDRALAREVVIFRNAGPESILRRFQAEAARDPLNTFGLFSAAGEQVAGDTRLKPSDLQPDGAPQNVGGRGRGPPERALEATLPWGETLIVERDTSQLVELRQIILGALLWSGAGIVGLGLLCGVALSLRPLRRVQAFQDTGEAIAAGDVSLRLPVDGSRDELDELARIVNAMMDEVERLVVQARTVGEGVAHELRTPLTRLRATLDHARQAFDPADPRRQLLERCVAETESVLARFQALLRIAAVEARRRQGGFSQCSLGAVVELVGELYAPLAAERGIALEVQAAAEVTLRGDPDLLVEAVSNLVDNALKFTPPGGAVRLSLARTAAGGPVISVADDGPGIAPSDRALVTKRFYRSPAQAHVPGHGLGLSLVAAVADLHGFDLRIEDAGPGAVISLVGRVG